MHSGSGDWVAPASKRPWRDLDGESPGLTLLGQVGGRVVVGVQVRGPTVQVRGPTVQVRGPTGGKRCLHNTDEIVHDPIDIHHLVPQVRDVGVEIGLETPHGPVEMHDLVPQV